MELKLTGTIKQVGELKTWDSGFSKLEFVITTADQYPQDVKFEIVKDKADNFLKFNKVGDNVDVSFNVRGNEYEGKYYVNLEAWKVFKVGAETPEANDHGVTNQDVKDDLPF